MVIDEELDYWPMSRWADPENSEHFANELAEATSMEEDEIEACLAFVADPANRMSEMQQQCDAEYIERLFKQSIADIYSDWEEVGEQWSDDHGGKELLDALMALARRTGRQDVMHELVAELGREVAETEADRHWWYETETGDDGHVFCLARPGT